MYLWQRNSMMVWNVCVGLECAGVYKGSPVYFRLKEIQMSEYDAATYERFSGAVRRQVQSLRIILDSLQVNISSQLSQRVCAVFPRPFECSFLSFLSHTHGHTASHSCYYSCFSFHPAFALKSWNNYPLSLSETKCYCCFSEWPLSGHPVMWCAKADCEGCLDSSAALLGISFAARQSNDSGGSGSLLAALLTISAQT